MRSYQFNFLGKFCEDLHYSGTTNQVTHKIIWLLRGSSSGVQTFLKKEWAIFADALSASYHMAQKVLHEQHGIGRRRLNVLQDQLTGICALTYFFVMVLSRTIGQEQWL